jgi:hypothetical protein
MSACGHQGCRRPASLTFELARNGERLTVAACERPSTSRACRQMTRGSGTAR